MATRALIIISSGDKDVVLEVGLRYSFNAATKGWLDEVIIIFFGPSEKLAANDREIQVKIRDLLNAGIKIMACKGCADLWDITSTLEEIGLEVVFVGPVISKLLNDGWASLVF